MSWEKVSSEYVHENPWYKVRSDKVIGPTGNPGTYNVIETRGSVYIVAVDEKQCIPLVKIERYTTGIVSYEIPAGGIEDEDILVAAQRELEEEVGLSANTWKQLGALQEANGISNAMANIFLATDLFETVAHGQAEEGISDTKRVSFPEAKVMIKSGEISCAQSIAAIIMAAIELDIKF
jgi:8-oxo-dGTP pyrophosphatase MutT (NUDIX family)